MINILAALLNYPPAVAAECIGVAWLGWLLARRIAFDGLQWWGSYQAQQDDREMRRLVIEEKWARLEAGKE